MKYFLILFLTNITLYACSQTEFRVLDSNGRSPVSFATIHILSQNISTRADINGLVRIKEGLNDSDTILISALGYSKIIVPFSAIKKELLLTHSSMALKEVVISPKSARDYIEQSWDSFQKNHVPFSFVQKAFFREEYFVNGEYLKFQEMDIDLYQFPKNYDSKGRKRYVSGSYPVVKKYYSVTDTFVLDKVKKSFGKLIRKGIEVDEMTMYSYLKGSNIMNWIYTLILDDEDNK